MTRKKAIEIVVEAAEGTTWYPADWAVAGVNGFQSSRGICGRGAAVGFATKTKDKELLKKGCTKRADGGWNFTRKWLEEKGYL